MVNVFSIHKGATESLFRCAQKRKKRERVASSEQRSDSILDKNITERKGDLEHYLLIKYLKMIEQNFAFNTNQLPLLQQTSTIPVSVSGSTRPAHQSEDSQSGQHYTGASQPNYNSSNAGSPTFATNYAMSQQMSQSASYSANAINPGEFGMYRSSYLHSHAKPPYSYISLIAMAIQVFI